MHPWPARRMRGRRWPPGPGRLRLSLESGSPLSRRWDRAARRETTFRGRARGRARGATSPRWRRRRRTERRPGRGGRPTLVVAKSCSSGASESLVNAVVRSSDCEGRPRRIGSGEVRATPAEKYVNGHEKVRLGPVRVPTAAGAPRIHSQRYLTTAAVLSSSSSRAICSRILRSLRRWSAWSMGLNSTPRSIPQHREAQSRDCF